MAYPPSGGAGTPAITCPALVVAGSESPSIFAQRQQRLLTWLPLDEAFTLPGAGHRLMLEQPRPLAEALAAFMAGHPDITATDTDR